MRGRRTMGSEGMGWASWVGIAVAVLVVAGVVGLAIYGGTIDVVQHPVEQVVPNDHFPN